MTSLTTNSQQTSGVSATFLGKELRGGSYLIQEKVSQGGSAWLFRGRHISLDEPMAIKILYPQFLEDPTIRQRFLEEARIQFRLRHQNVVHITDLINEEYCLGSVMEWIEGPDLRAYMRHHKGPKPPIVLELLLLPIIQALQYVHQQDLVHRDIKPANILLQRQTGGFHPKLTDFGIAKMLLEEGNTMTGSTLGTVTYMAPEQINDAKQVTLHADIYSLGVIMFEMLTGRVPFQGNPQQQVIKHLSQEPPTLRSLQPSVSPELERVVLRCLAKDPKERPVDCSALLLDLHDALKVDTRKTFAQQALPALPVPASQVVPAPGLNTDLELMLDQVLEKESSGPYADDDDLPTTLSLPEDESSARLSASLLRRPMTPVASSRLEGLNSESRHPLLRRDVESRTTPEMPVLPADISSGTVPPSTVGSRDLPVVPAEPESGGPLQILKTHALLRNTLGIALAVLLMCVAVFVFKKMSAGPGERAQSPSQSREPVWRKPERASRKTSQANALGSAKVCFDITPNDVKFRFKIGKKKSLRRGSFCVELKEKSRVILWRYGYHSCEFDIPMKQASYVLWIKAKHVKLSSDVLNYCVMP